MGHLTLQNKFTKINFCFMGAKPLRRLHGSCSPGRPGISHIFADTSKFVLISQRLCLDERCPMIRQGTPMHDVCQHDADIKQETTSLRHASRLIPVWGQSIPRIWQHAGPAQACPHSRVTGGAACSWLASPLCCCRPLDPPGFPPVGRGFVGSGGRSLAPTGRGKEQQKVQRAL